MRIRIPHIAGGCTRSSRLRCRRLRTRLLLRLGLGFFGASPEQVADALKGCALTAVGASTALSLLSPFLPTLRQFCRIAARRRSRSRLGFGGFGRSGLCNRRRRDRAFR
jgi:hypothetical protein